MSEQEAQKHDGHLDDQNDYVVAWEGESIVIRGGNCDCAELDRKRALSLLVWLKQELEGQAQ